MSDQATAAVTVTADAPAPLAAIGISGPKFAMPLELGKLREFARATSAPAAPYLLDESPPLTPTFLTTSRLWEQDNPWAKLGLSAGRVLHAEQEFVFHGAPPRVGARLVGQSTIDDVYVKEGRRGRMIFAVMATRFFDEAEQIVAESRMTGVEMPPAAPKPAEPQASAATAPPPGQAAAAPPGQAAAAPAGQAAAAPAGAAPREAAPGAVVQPPGLAAAPPPAVHGPLTITDFVRYQGASGDMNPLHHDPEKAKLAGFSAPISVGMLQAGLLASYAVSWLGAEQIRRFRVRFQAPVLAGDVITCRAEGAVRQDDGAVEAHVVCVREGGGLAAEAWALFAPEPCAPGSPS